MYAAFWHFRKKIDPDEEALEAIEAMADPVHKTRVVKIGESIGKEEFS